jgi:hypothetical protein
MKPPEKLSNSSGGLFFGNVHSLNESAFSGKEEA